MAASRDHSAAARSRVFEEASVATQTAVTFLALTQGARPGQGREFHDGRPLPVIRAADGGFRSAVPAGRRGLGPLDVREACRRAARELYPNHGRPHSRWLPADPPGRTAALLHPPVLSGGRLRKQ